MTKKPTSKPTNAELKELKDYLKAQGFKANELDEILGASVSNRARQDFALILQNHLKRLKKKVS